MSGIDGIRILKGLYPDLVLLMLTVYDDDERILMPFVRRHRLFVEKDTAQQTA
jgi:hypothetical protein